MNKARIIVGANYGDEGKGSVTAHYSNVSRDVLNVLTNGGSQRGHTAVCGKGSHVFHHFGSGTYQGAASYYSRFFIINPMQFTKEYRQLVVKPKVYRDRRCMWSTPYDMMANAIEREMKGTHDTCGMGIWNTIKRYRKTPTVQFDVFVQLSPELQSDYLDSVRMYYERRMRIPDDWKGLWLSEGMKRHFLSDCFFMHQHTVSDATEKELAERYPELVFENGQGLLLCDTGKDTADTTPSNTGSSYSIELLMNMGVLGPDARPTGGSEVSIHYVTRPYLTRHGDGGMEDCIDRAALSSGVGEDATNVHNQFQGGLRYGRLDIGSLKERVELDACGIPYEIELTHCDEMDRVSEFRQMFRTINVYDKPDIE